jgi:cytochrome b561
LEIFNSSATDENSFFKGQIFIAKVNHFLLYLSIFTITISGVLKKLYMGEKLNFLFFKYGFKKIIFN